MSYAGRAMNKPVAVAPFHWHFSERPQITLDETELQHAAYLPFGEFRKWDSHSSGRLATAYPEKEYSYYEFEGTPLWGFTYQVLRQWISSH